MNFIGKYHEMGDPQLVEYGRNLWQMKHFINLTASQIVLKVESRKRRRDSATAFEISCYEIPAHNPHFTFSKTNRIFGEKTSFQ